VSPNVYIIAGPNGAGKTTFAREFLPKYADCRNFINADLIAQGMSPFSPESAAIRAGRLMLGEIELSMRRRVDFGFETTLSGRSHLGVMRRLKERTYQVHIFYLWVPSVELALARIRDRVCGADMMCLKPSYDDGSSGPLQIFWCSIACWRTRGICMTIRPQRRRSLPPRKKGSFA